MSARRPRRAWWNIAALAPALACGAMIGWLLDQGLLAAAATSILVMGIIVVTEITCRRLHRKEPGVTDPVDVPRPGDSPPGASRDALEIPKAASSPTGCDRPTSRERD
ncbi:hypothetical protein SMC26_08040 [Actinomadura fulvescens]|uniref:Uncharacterized protein n=1 Tax=Actinomadura fulvescens TaxID=46160 RepID=A0ABP6D9I9_9ACTN